MLIGAGGSGSQIAIELFQMDSLLRSISNGTVYLDVTICDGDEVSLFNVGRQAFYMGDVGHNKASVLVDRFNMFGQTNWRALTNYVNANTLTSLDTDFIITAVDKAKFRVDLGQKLEASTSKKCLLWLDVGNGKSDGQIILGHAYQNVDVELRIPNVYDLYGSMLDSIDDEKEDAPSCSTEAALQKQDFGVNRAVSGQATQLIWQLIRYGKLTHHGAFVDVLTASVQPLKIDPAQWEVFGYANQSKVEVN